MRASDGNQIWSYEFGAAGVGGLDPTVPIIADGLVFVSSANTLYAFDATNGNLIWKYTADSRLTSPVIADSTLYVGSESGKVYAFRDTTPPTTTDNAPSAWQTGGFTVTLTCTDNPGGSGCKETKYNVDASGWQTGNSVSISTEGDLLIEYYSIDNAGNQESTESTHAKLDKTAPTITGTRSPDANSYGWNNVPVTVSFTCSDSLSGVDSCPVPTTLSDDGAGQSVTGTATDNAGNTASYTVTGINIDKTPPSVTIGSPTNGGTYTLNAAVASTYSCADTTSGVATCSGQVPNGVNFDTSTVGPHTFTVNAQDAAGNIVSRTVTYNVAYAFSGVRPPIDPDGSTVRKLGSTVPVKFELYDANGNYVSIATARMYIAKITNGVVGPDMPAVSTSAATTDNLFRLAGNQYIFNWNTKGLTEGTWEIKIVLDDGTTHTVNITLKP